jgi:hypothetical protein
LKTAGRKENKPPFRSAIEIIGCIKKNRSSGDDQKVFSVPMNPFIFDRRWSFYALKHNNGNENFSASVLQWHHAKKNGLNTIENAPK